MGANVETTCSPSFLLSSIFWLEAAIFAWHPKAGMQERGRAGGKSSDWTGEPSPLLLVAEHSVDSQISILKESPLVKHWSVCIWLCSTSAAV